MTNPFQSKNLQCKDFSGQDLSFQDFSHADIRGTNFNKAILVGANFRQAKAGLPTSWVIGLAIASLASALLAGLVSGYASALLSNLWVDQAARITFGVFTIALVIGCIPPLQVHKSCDLSKPCLKTSRSGF